MSDERQASDYTMSETLKLLRELADEERAAICGEPHCPCAQATMREGLLRDLIERLSAGDVSIREFQQINAARSARWMAGSPGWTTLEIAGELAGEVGELANVCKKLRRSELGVPGNKVSDELLMQRARSEMADVFIVLALTASKLGVDLEDAVRDTFNAKSEQMGFPERVGAMSSSPLAPTQEGA